MPSPKVFVKPLRKKRDGVADISDQAHQSLNVAHEVFLKMRVPEAQVYSQSANSWMLLYLDQHQQNQKPPGPAMDRPPRVLANVANMDRRPNHGSPKGPPRNLDADVDAYNPMMNGRRTPPPPAASPEHSPEAQHGGPRQVPPPPWFGGAPGQQQQGQQGIGYPPGPNNAQFPGGPPPPIMGGNHGRPPAMGNNDDLPPRQAPQGVALMHHPGRPRTPSPGMMGHGGYPHPQGHGVPGFCVSPPPHEHLQGGHPMPSHQQPGPEKYSPRLNASLSHTQQALYHMLGQMPQADEDFAMHFRWFITRYRWLFVRGKATELKEIVGDNGQREIADGVIRGDGDLQALRDVFKRDKTHFPADPSTYVAEESSELYKLAKQRLRLHRQRVVGVHAPPTMLGVYYSGHGLPETGALVFGDRELTLIEVLPVIGGVCSCIVFDSCYSGASMLGLMRAWETVQKGHKYKTYKQGGWTEDKSPENCLMEWASLMASHLLLPSPNIIFEKAQVKVSPPTGITPRYLRGLIHDFLLQDNLYPLLIVLGSCSKEKQAKQTEAGGLFTLWLSGFINSDMSLPTAPSGTPHSAREQEPCVFAVALPRDILAANSTGSVNLGHAE